MTARFFITALFALSVSACASKPKEMTPAAPPSPPPAAEASSSEPMPMASAEAIKMALNPKAEAEPKLATELPKKIKPKAKGVDPKQALLWLEHGNKRFMKGHLRKDGQGKKDIAILSSGQNPHSIVLSCSDSRVPPEIVFDQKLGEIFVIRTAGESLDANVVASIEYAVAHLGSKLILVMGHTSCGAINAAIGTADGGDAGSPSLNHLVADIQPRIRASLAKGKPTPDMARESMANAAGIAEDLKRMSPIIRDAVEKGELDIKSALYHLESGEVTFL